MELALNFYQDPGHGWLQVHHRHIKELNLQDDITPYSYIDERYVYLEEDLDACVFMQKAKVAGYTITYTEIHQENTPIRRMRAYDSSFLH
jgi:hypothetical protein